MKLDFEKMGGLVPAIIQDAETGQVLMLAYMNPFAWEKTLETGKAWFYSRSRDKQCAFVVPVVVPQLKFHPQA